MTIAISVSGTMERSNQQYAGAYLKAIARLDCTTGTPIDGIPVMVVTTSGDDLIRSLPIGRAIPPDPDTSSLMVRSSTSGLARGVSPRRRDDKT